MADHVTDHATDHVTDDVSATPDRPPASAERPTGPRRGLARALGGLSLALAGPPLAVTEPFCDAIGVGTGPRQRLLARIVGGRELAAALGLLAVPNAVFLWSRVAGDAMDLALLGRSLAGRIDAVDGGRRGLDRGLRRRRDRDRDRSALQRTAVATAAVAGITALDVYAALTRTREERRMELTATTTVTTPPAQTYAFWKNLENLPTFMAHVDAVHDEGNGRSHWAVSAPFGRTVEWDAQTTHDEPERRIAWQSVDDADVANSGEVEFTPAPGGRGTEVHVRIAYRMPGGKLGAAVARYFGEEPHQQLDDDLRRFKQIVETGEIVRSDGAPEGKHARHEFPQHPARPLTDEELTELTTEAQA